MKSEKDTATTEDDTFEGLEDAEESSSLVADESVEELAEKELGSDTPADTEIALRSIMSEGENPDDTDTEDAEPEDSTGEMLSDVAPRQKNEAVCVNCFCIVPKLSIDKATKLCQSCNY